MPIRFLKDATAPVVLPYHQTLPPDERLSFTARFLSKAEGATRLRLINEALDAERDGDGAQAAAKLVEVLSLTLTGWNLPDPFDAARLVEMLTDTECWELVREANNQVTIAEADLKKSKPPAPSDTAEPAVAAPAAA